MDAGFIKPIAITPKKRDKKLYMQDFRLIDDVLPYRGHHEN